MEENKDIYRIFFSWQADRSKVRSAIFEKLNEAYFMLVTCSAFINYLRGITSAIEQHIDERE